MQQSNLFVEVGHKVRNPFALLESDEDLKLIHEKSIDHERFQSRTNKKSVNLPFSKFEIKHETKEQKVQPKDNKEKNQNKDHQQKKAQSTEKSSDKKKLTKEQQTAANNIEKQEEKSEIKQNDNRQSYQEDQYYEQENDKKYLLTKKIREVKYELNADGDPPLLYDIGLEPEMIKDKVRLVLKMGEPDYDMIMNPDLAGPVAIAFAFGFLLLFCGKIHFGDIYALFIMGNLFLFVLFNFMARSGTISLYSIMSILGYCLLPMLVLGGVGIFFSLKSGFGLLFSLLISIWSSVAGGNFIEALIKGKKNRKLLIVYPLFLFYSNFAMIVIF